MPAGALTPPSEWPPTIHVPTSGARPVKVDSGRRSKNARFSPGVVMTTASPSSVTSPERSAAYAHGSTFAPGMNTSAVPVAPSPGAGASTIPAPSSAIAMRSSARTAASGSGYAAMTPTWP